jgi:hypothetical protein
VTISSPSRHCTTLATVARNGDHKIAVVIAARLLGVVKNEQAADPKLPVNDEAVADRLAENLRRADGVLGLRRPHAQRLECEHHGDREADRNDCTAMARPSLTAVIPIAQSEERRKVGRSNRNSHGRDDADDRQTVFPMNLPHLMCQQH